MHTPAALSNLNISLHGTYSYTLPTRAKAETPARRANNKPPAQSRAITTETETVNDRQVPVPGTRDAYTLNTRIDENDPPTSALTPSSPKGIERIEHETQLLLCMYLQDRSDAGAGTERSAGGGGFRIVFVL
ncbi:hypothetical protein T440DRAFT_204288 [Plenodomus tracheiphilus IPT5]|uniref:Uncharacterized protein n=1 Tax=Plenodomus tracheiphilus IPT5 TaxID=1408161 RepID=A0A6A7BHW9_9PLEO|nr:hypothetical protein T440DRAFT_204288 [Plenodomus tracheiphilus IPT5]